MSGSRLAVAEDQSQVDKLVERRAEDPDVIKVVRYSTRPGLRRVGADRAV